MEITGSAQGLPPRKMVAMRTKGCDASETSVIAVNSINTGTITPGKSLMFG